MKDFAPNTKGYKILTDNGYRDFSGIAYMGDKRIFRVEFANAWLECTEDHRIIDWKMEEVSVNTLKAGDKIFSLKGGYTTVVSVTDTGRIEPVYDIIDVKGHRYFANGILSHNCEFIPEDATLIDGMVLKDLTPKPEIKKTGNVYWYDELLPNYQYMVALDPAVGAGNGDYAAIQVFRLPDLVQVAEWRSQKAIVQEQVKTLLQILHYINNTLRNDPDQEGEPEIIWTIENNAIGQAILQVIDHTGEENFPGWFVHEPKKPGMGGRRKGLNTNKRTKLQACSKLKYLIESRRMKLSSKALMKELKNYVGSGDTFAAKLGETDDLVSACLLVVRMIEIVAQHDETIYEQMNDGVSWEDGGDDTAPMPILL